jgi:hypothetical protein
MTRSRSFLGLFFILIFVSGCQWKWPGKRNDDSALPPKPPTAETISRLQNLAPGAAIGHVLAILPNDRLASVGNVPVQDFKTGDVLTFLGGETNPLADGEVVAIVKDTLHVRYRLSPNSPRAPEVGDVAIRLKN